MLGVSLQYDSEEMLGRLDDLAAFSLSGRTCGIPLLHPWANRLASDRYVVAGQQVSLEGAALINRDDSGLPIHGVSWAHLAWRLVSENARQLRAQLNWNQPDRLAVFPFPHMLDMKVSLEGATLRVETELTPTGDHDVPLSFGFHPYFRLPGVPRAEWQLQLPAMTHLLLDARNVPADKEEPFEGYQGLLGEQTFDDGYRLSGPHAEFQLGGRGRRITVTLLEGYTHAQIYAPAGKDFIAFEPMTAPTNALVSGSHLRLLKPGVSFHASFQVRVESLP
ncbi:MAG: aldose 1-epimerase [Anaerolineae bacterium]